ncbi:hypothetical protein BDW02DRAFT_143107 [Decorospora gaudefroyi]|uniref:Uncharacterized protein n=1 Tax=Decorospora gaudefroyi TaxID=184978 RepID=A0A6A5K539_9PLEO|nr:hypothetical protein BDW02DRAFT_143107 [Decorospora gaudefroyi]
MFSIHTRARLFLSLVLITAFHLGSTDLRIVIAVMTSWALGYILLKRFETLSEYRRAYWAYVAGSFIGLSATNDIFYENTCGRMLDVVFTQDASAPNIPGSGFPDWWWMFQREYDDEIECVIEFCLAVVRWTIGVVSLVAMVVLGLVHYLTPPNIADAIEHLGKTGEMPAWWLEQRAAAVPEVARRDTRYNWMSDELIFVCGHRGGFEKVIDGDIEGAIARRRALRPRFA